MRPSFFVSSLQHYIGFLPARSGFTCEVGSNSVFGICLDRFNHQVELVGTVDLARHAPYLVRRDYLGFREVIEPVQAFGVKVFHDKNHTGFALHP